MNDESWGASPPRPPDLAGRQATKLIKNVIFLLIKIIDFWSFNLLLRKMDIETETGVKNYPRKSGVLIFLTKNVFLIFKPTFWIKNLKFSKFQSPKLVLDYIFTLLDPLKRVSRPQVI